MKKGEELHDDVLEQVVGGIGQETAQTPSDEKTTGSAADDPSGYQISERMRVH